MRESWRITKPSTLQHLVSILLGVVCLGSPATAFAEGSTAFEGTWRIDLERSDPINREGLKVDNSYRLELAGDDLQVVRTFYSQGQSRAVDWTVVTDGKPHEIPGLRAPRRARAKWKKEKLNVSYTISFDTPRGAFDLDVQEIWSVDGDELEIRYVTRLPNRTQTRTERYVREAEAP